MFYSLVKRHTKLLNHPKIAWEFYVENTFNIACFKFFKRKIQNGKVWGRKIHTREQANDLIYEGLMSDKPFSVMRNGANEAKFVLYKDFIEMGVVDEYSEYVLNIGHNNAGVFPQSKEIADFFAETYAEANGQADITVYWGHILCEKYLLDKYAPKAEIIPSRPLEPFEFKRPWTAALKGKKVLVIHPFAKTIEKQYLKRETIHKNPDILPEFELKTIKAVQSSAGGECGLENWFEALDYMKKEIDKIDFDIAVLGCGGYAVPLAAYIKSIGKKSVITGGVTQILFGIKGKRWEMFRPDIVAMFNDSWVRPDDSEKPKKSNSIEEGAYW